MCSCCAILAASGRTTALWIEPRHARPACLFLLPITSAQVSTRQRHESGRFACLFDECTGCPDACLRFVRIFGACFNVVFRGQKICLRYFKIGQTYFEICALYFFFAPMWGKRSENQFPISAPKTPVFADGFSNDSDAINRVPTTAPEHPLRRQQKWLILPEKHARRENN